MKKTKQTPQPMTAHQGVNHNNNKNNSMVSDNRGNDASIPTHSDATDDDAKKIMNDRDSNVIVPGTDLSRLDRTIWIITTAAMPWRTGTAVNPLMRALYLTRGRPHHAVTLCIPWLENGTARKALYGTDTPNDMTSQEMWIRNFCRERAGCPTEEAALKIQFWKGEYHDAFGSIFPVEDICTSIPKDQADVAILEEPEHLNWFRAPASTTPPKPSKKSPTKRRKKTDKELSSSQESNANDSLSTNVSPPNDNNDDDDDDYLGWRFKFNHVVGILHTNYGDYVRQYGMGVSLLTAPALDALSTLVVKAYCHQVIRLSATLPSLDEAREVTCNVHGVRAEFLHPLPSEPLPAKSVAASDKESQHHDAVVSGSDENAIAAPVYFIGKLIWAKGFGNILELQEIHREMTGTYFAIDVYGSGKDQVSIQRAFFGRHGPPSRASSSVSSTSDMTNQRAADVFGTSESLRKHVHLASSIKYDELGTEQTLQDVSNTPGATSLSFPSSSNTHAELTPSHESHSRNISDPPTLPVVDADSDGRVDADTAAAEDETSAHASDTSSEDNNNGNNNTAAVEQDETKSPKSSSVSPIDILGDLSGKTYYTGIETADAALRLINSVVDSIRSCDGGRNRTNDGGRKSHVGDGTAVTTTMRAASSMATDDDNNDDDVEGDVTSEPSEKDDDGFDKDQIASDNKTNSEPDVLPQSKKNKKRHHHHHHHRNPITKLRSRFKWRRIPLPARFCGVQDHIALRDLPSSKIFLNMSTSEVLCTTSAEALAMNKFVILPEHPSNDFFYQFPNCLSYTTLDECVIKLKFATDHDPTPLSAEHQHVLSWEGAIDRLYQAASITKVEWEHRKALHMDESSRKAAKFHVEASKKSLMVADLFRNNILLKKS